MTSGPAASQGVLPTSTSTLQLLTPGFVLEPIDIQGMIINAKVLIGEVSENIRPLKNHDVVVPNINLNLRSAKRLSGASMCKNPES